MTRERYQKNSFSTALFFCFFLFTPSVSFSATDTAIIDVDQNILTTQGKVKSIEREKQLLLIKTSKGERVRITLTWDTALTGYSSLQEIKNDQGVKIWYTIKAGKKIAVKIEQKLEVGC